MRELKINKQVKRPDTPLAATPAPLTDKEADSMFKKAGSIKKPKSSIK